MLTPVTNSQLPPDRLRVDSALCLRLTGFVSFLREKRIRCRDR